ncbi:hypothetical protein D3C85_1183200 [compost metagenome]
MKKVIDALYGSARSSMLSDSTIKMALSEPPFPIISIESKRVTVVRGSSCWKANNIGTCSDMISPPELVKKITPTIVSPGSRVKIQFEYQSNELGMNQWVDTGPKNVVLEQVDG